MWTFPVLLDCRSSGEGDSPGSSLLLAPLGTGTVLEQLRSRLDLVTNIAPIVVSNFEITPEYVAAVRVACPDVETVESLAAFAERCRGYDPSDRLLLGDPTCFPLDPLDPALQRLLEEGEDRWARHVVALERSSEGTREFVDADGDGRVRAIQRYYDDVTWPFASGVACSLIPLACLRLNRGLPLGSLRRLRRVLASQGVPGRDLPIEHGAVNLASSKGLLAANERLALDLERIGRLHDSGATVHPAATLVGPVVLQPGASVGEGATVVGPSVLGRGAQVGRGATVARCVVGSGQAVRAGQTVYQRILLASVPGSVEEGLDASLLEPSPDEWAAAPSQPGASRPPSAYERTKRVLDMLAAAAALVLLAPLGLLIAALLKIESRGRGSILFAHLREGLGGTPFRCWKFRTMVPNADVQQLRLAQMNEADGPQFRIDRDPRRTRVGRLLSALNLDELPQLWNVLVGEMSLVGPRPSPFRENQVCVPWREGRLSVRPGITGLWQVCRHDRDKSDFHQWIYYDLLYVRNLSLALDVRILVCTFLALARGGSVPLSWLLPAEKYGDRRGRGGRAHPVERRSRAGVTV